MESSKLNNMVRIVSPEVNNEYCKKILKVKKKCVARTVFESIDP